MQTVSALMLKKCLAVCIILMLSSCAQLHLPLGFGHSMEQVYRIPVNVVALNGKHPDLKADINEQALMVVMKEVNVIWRQANIVFDVVSYQSMPANNESRYEEAIQTPQAISEYKETMSYLLKATCPRVEAPAEHLQLCIVGNLFNHAGGAFFNDDEPLAIWSTMNDYPQLLTSASLAHEFGHFLDLPHNHHSTKHLMREKSGRYLYRQNIEDIVLNEDEIAHARKVAKSLHLRLNKVH